MNAIEKRIKDLYEYNPDSTAPEDLSTFWQNSLDTMSERPFHARREKVSTPLAYVEAYKVAYQGFDETPISAWHLLPAFGLAGPYPTVVVYHGYTGGKGLPERYAPWLLMGIAVFAVDVRGQGGDTGNLLAQEGGMARGWITQNITDPERCYYKAITIDALRALEYVCGLPETDPNRVGVSGASQGGGLALMAGALSTRPQFVIADIPNMCHMDWGVLHSTGSLTEAADYAARFPESLDAVLRTLGYFDVINLADRITLPVLMSVGLKDTVCMPETVFAAYNRIRSDKSLRIYPFTGHAVSEDQARIAMEFAAKHIL